MTAVFEHSASKASARLVLLSMADEANDEGLLTAYRRSHSYLAKKANVDEGTVGRAVKALVAIEELEILKQGDGRASGDYRILLPGLRTEGWQSATPQPGSEPTRGGNLPPQGSQSATPIIPLSPTTPTSSTKRTSFPPPGAFVLTDAMQAWAAKETPTVDVVLQTKQFADHWRGKGEKRADWVATWRTWMRNAEAWGKPGRKANPPATGTTSNTRTYESEEEFDAWQASQRPRP